MSISTRVCRCESISTCTSMTICEFDVCSIWPPVSGASRMSSDHGMSIDTVCCGPAIVHVQASTTRTRPLDEVSSLPSIASRHHAAANDQRYKCPGYRFQPSALERPDRRHSRTSASTQHPTTSCLPILGRQRQLLPFFYVSSCFCFFPL